MSDPICPDCGFPQSEWATFCQHNFGRLQAYVAEYVNDSPAALRVRLTEAQWNALEMARKTDLAERRAEEAEFHVEQLRDARDSAEQRIEQAEAEVERLRDALLQVRRAFDLQCPPMPADKYVDRGAWMAHSWWNTVLGDILNRAGAGDIQGGEPARDFVCCEIAVTCLSEHSPAPGTCEHQWLDRPESDTRECLICGTEVAG